MKLVDNLAKKFIRSLPAHILLDDLKQVGYVELCRLALRYKPEQGAEFSTFAVPRIVGSFKDYVRQEIGRNGEKLAQAYYSELADDNIVPDSIDETISLEEQVVQREDARLAFTHLRSRLSPREREVAGMIMSDHSQRQISESLGMTEARVSQLMKSMQKKSLT